MNFDTDPTSLRGQRLAEQRTFVLAGKEFRYRSSAPAQVMDAYRNIGEQPDDDGLWRVLDLTMLDLLEPGQEEAWRSATAEGVTWRDMMEVIGWVAGRIVGRPPSSASPSSSTPGELAETSSMDGSSWREQIQTD